MNLDSSVPRIVRDFLTYIETISGKSPKTASEYFLDIRTFLRFIKIKRNLVRKDTEFNQIDISDVDIALVTSITLSDIYDFMQYESRERPRHQNSKETKFGINAASRARKASAIRVFFRFLTNKAHLLEVNPAQNLDVPKIKKSLPKNLSLSESLNLLSAVDGPFKERDYCILTLFLNCGLRVSELVGMDIQDIKDDTLRVLGKGNKERVIYLNEACLAAINDYITTRIVPLSGHKNALFISRMKKRINVQTVKWLVKKYLDKAGLDVRKYSVHKLRHTAATLMYQNGVDVRTLRDVLGHENLDTTMIYTHISDENLRQAAGLNPLAQVTPRRKKD